ncbi:Supervillin [Schistosoma japonicum]|nr:Supervillin [Schistosoma japonicum]
MEQRYNELNPVSVVSSNRSKYFYTNFSAATEDNNNDHNNRYCNNYSPNQSDHNINQYDRHKSCAESIISSNCESHRKHKVEENYDKPNKSFRPFSVHMNNNECNQVTLNKGSLDNNKNGSLTNVHKSNNTDNQHTVEPLTQKLNKGISTKRSSKIANLVNLLYKNADETNRQHMIIDNNSTCDNFRSVNLLKESGLQEGSQTFIQNKPHSGKLPRTQSQHLFNKHTNNTHNENNIFNKHLNNNIGYHNTSFQAQNNKEDSYPQMSISERIACIRQNSLNWRGRVEKEAPNIDRSCGINKIHLSLVENQESWKKRVESKTDHELGIFERSKKPNTYSGQEFLPLNRLNSQDSITPVIKCLPAEPIIRTNSKENRRDSENHGSLTRTTSVNNPSTMKWTSPFSKQVSYISQNISVPTSDDKALENFFTTKPVYEPASAAVSVELPTLSSQPNDELKNVYERIADARRSARPERRKPPTDLKNPLKALEQRENIKSNYEEVRISTKPVDVDRPSNKNITPFQTLLRTVDPSVKIGLDCAAKIDILADSAKAGLASSEDINEAKNSLRSFQDGQTLRNISTQRQLLPYKPIMLLHIKGRRHVQVRLVAPSAKSINSGDCFILITTNSVFAWFGESANIVEVNKTRELASWIYKKHELSYHGNSGEAAQNYGNGYISVYENTGSSDVTNELDNDVPSSVTSSFNQSSSASLKFWKTLGYDAPQLVHDAGPPEEDERYEAMIQHTNRVYRVTLTELVPYEQCWGNPVKYHILQSDQAFVFDFGSEMYLWTGKQITPELRQAGIELINKAYNMNYDFSRCKLNPLDPLNSHNSDILALGCKRPEWTLVGKVTERGETVLFKEKFFDWPDTSRIQIKSLKPGKLVSTESSPTSASLTMEPYSANELYEAAVNNPPPPPNLLTLEGRYIGRGGKVCRYEDGILRQFWVETNELRVWHVSEFARHELPSVSHGQFHKEDTYVIRWSYKITYSGLRNGNKRSNENAPEHCAYFFWQGSQSKVTEKGASALMTIELDEERGPQVRVIEGREPPVFCYVFNGRMITYAGKRTTQKQTTTRLFIVRGEVLEEGHLIEVPVQLNSLRPQGVLLLVQYNQSPFIDSAQIIKAFCWIGQLAPKEYLATAKYVFSQLLKCCPPELGKNLTEIHEIHQYDKNELSKEFLNILEAEDQLSSPLCLDSIKSHSRVAIWQFTHHRGRKLGVERLNYALQPDPASLPINGTLVKSRTNNASSTDGGSERLLTSQNTIICHLSQSSIEPAFPYLLEDLYSVSQPSLFLIITQIPSVYIWEGWWPISGLTRSRFMSQKSLRSCSTFSKSPSTPGDCTEDFRWSTSLDESFEVGSQTSPDGSFYLEETAQPTLTGTGRSRFCAIRKAAIATAKALADKVGTQAYLIYAGLEPPEFLALFPPHAKFTDAIAYHQFEDGKTDGQKDLVDRLLSSYTTASYTLSDLQQRPLPPELDATCLETYLDENTFQETFSMSKEDFDKLPIWKQSEMKKYLGLF